MIPVTKPYLPDQQKYMEYVFSIFDSNWITNNGPLVQKLQHELKKYLELEKLLFVSNGTIAIQLAIKSLGLIGEIITTPFSYVATTSSVVWEGCKPVFVDIDPDTLNIDPCKIEQSITDKTSAILATHCFGNACDIEAIEIIAEKHQLKVIYDAAHCFGTKYKGKSIFDYGDISTSSFHATKLMHSVEGGLVVTNKKEILEKLSYMRNFGHDGPERFNGVGINAKNSEFHAAMGLCVLEDIDTILQKRKEQSKIYDTHLKNKAIRKPQIQDGCSFNFAYYPILFKNEAVALKVKTALELKDIHPRRYFYPSLNKLSYTGNQNMPISENTSKTILCLPLYDKLLEEDQMFIVKVINEVLNDK